MKRAAVYVRVSTDNQTCENQLLAIRRYCGRRDWQIAGTFRDDSVSGGDPEREQLQRLKAEVARGRFDVVVVWKFDRLARSTLELLETLNRFQACGTDFVSVTEDIDTSTATGRMVVTFLGAVGEFERELIRERVRAGLDRARVNGVKLGRPPKQFPTAHAVELRRRGLGYKQIGKALGLPRTTVFRHLRTHSENPVAERAGG